MNRQACAQRTQEEAAGTLNHGTDRPSARLQFCCSLANPEFARRPAGSHETGTIVKPVRREFLGMSVGFAFACLNSYGKTRPPLSVPNTHASRDISGKPHGVRGWPTFPLESQRRATQRWRTEADSRLQACFFFKSSVARTRSRFLRRFVFSRPSV